MEPLNQFEMQEEKVADNELIEKAQEHEFPDLATKYTNKDFVYFFINNGSWVQYKSVFEKMEIDGSNMHTFTDTHFEEAGI